MTETCLEFTLIVVSALIILFAQTIEEPILEYALVDRAHLVVDLLALAVFSIGKVVTRIGLLLGVVLPIALKTTADPLACVAVPISKSSLSLALKLRIDPGTCDNLFIQCHGSFAIKDRPVELT